MPTVCALAGGPGLTATRPGSLANGGVGEHLLGFGNHMDDLLPSTK